MTNVPDITDVPGTDISHLMNPGSEKRQSMQGFDDDYVDIVDYIVRITHKIWEEKGIGRIYDYYAHNVLIHTTDGQTYGRDKVIADTIKAIAAFPDVRLLTVLGASAMAGSTFMFHPKMSALRSTQSEPVQRRQDATPTRLA